MFERKKFYLFEMKEEDVMTFIKTINDIPNVAPIKCNVSCNTDICVNSRHAWIVTFYATKYEHMRILEKLYDIGNLRFDEKGYGCFKMK